MQNQSRIQHLLTHQLFEQQKPQKCQGPQTNQSDLTAVKQSGRLTAARRNQRSPLPTIDEKHRTQSHPLAPASSATKSPHR